jgi:8-oxo-dGTP pyrophosphatase MutT (NUDIX family)
MKIACTDIFGKSFLFDEAEYVERAAVYGILKKDTSILLVRDAWGKKWGLPGGGIDKGETPSEALVREFDEETGIIIANTMKEVISDSSYFKPQNEPHPWKTLRTIYVVTAIGGAIKESGNNIDVVEVKYFPIDESQKINLQPNTRQIFNYILSNK